MRGVNEGAVLVLRGTLQEIESIQELARARRLDAVELRVPQLSCGPLRLGPEAGEVSVDGAALALRKTERDVLTYLMQNTHRFVTPQELQEKVLKTHGDGGAARNQVYELRRKLRAAGHAQAIETRTHHGYRLRWSG